MSTQRNTFDDTYIDSLMTIVFSFNFSMKPWCYVGWVNKLNHYSHSHIQNYARIPKKDITLLLPELEKENKNSKCGFSK